MDDFKVFDFHRIFIGNAPPLYFLEIIFRTFIMYSYTVFLLRVLGKRGMGQLSMLELAIIISFGSAVGDPMIVADMPILYGLLAITVITITQIGFERLINKNRKVEAIMEGESNLVVNNGVINWPCMKRDNISKEDLFRSLREKDVEHLGQIKKAFFETSGSISVFFHSPKHVTPGLTVEPEEMIKKSDIHTKGKSVSETASFSCLNCGATVSMKKNNKYPSCSACSGETWIKATT